jgi:hypothetical protein
MNLDDGTDRLSRNFGKELPLYNMRNIPEEGNVVKTGRLCIEQVSKYKLLSLGCLLSEHPVLFTPPKETYLCFSHSMNKLVNVFN